MTPNTDLDRELDEYHRAVTAAPARSHRPWRAYAAAGGVGATLALAADAQAAIVYSGPLLFGVQQPRTSGSTGFFIDLDGDFSFDFGMGVSFGSDPPAYGGAAFLLAPFTGKSAIGTAGTSANLAFLPSGFSVSSNAFSFPTGGIGYLRGIATTTNGTIDSIGVWPGSSLGFAGVRFLIGGNTHYGWLRLVWGDGVPDPHGTIPDTLILFDYAYESTPGAPIQTGDTGPAAVPEPGEAGLALLALGAAGVAAWKRRRAAKAQSVA